MSLAQGRSVPLLPGVTPLCMRPALPDGPVGALRCRRTPPPALPRPPRRVLDLAAVARPIGREPPVPFDSPAGGLPFVRDRGPLGARVLVRGSLRRALYRWAPRWGSGQGFLPWSSARPAATGEPPVGAAPTGPRRESTPREDPPTDSLLPCEGQAGRNKSRICTAFSLWAVLGSNQ